MNEGCSAEDGKQVLLFSDNKKRCDQQCHGGRLYLESTACLKSNAIHM